MSRDIRGKLAAGKDLDAADIKYARERGIPLPDGLVSEDPDVVVEEPTGGQSQPESTDEVTTDEETPDAPEDADEAEDGSDDDSSEDEGEEVDMAAMSKAELVSLGEQFGLELSKRSSKQELMDAISAASNGG